MGKKLYKSNSDRMICGICGGLGEYFTVDSTIIRVLAILVLLGSFGTGVLLYLILAIIIPEE